MRYRGLVLSFTRSTLCGFRAFRYEVHDLGRLVMHGWHTGAWSQAVSYAKHAIDQRLAECGQQGVN